MKLRSVYFVNSYFPSQANMNTANYNPYLSPPKNKNKRSGQNEEDEETARDMGMLFDSTGALIPKRWMRSLHGSPTQPRPEDRCLFHFATSASLVFNNLPDTSYASFASGSVLELGNLPVTPNQMYRIIEEAKAYALLTSETYIDYFRNVDMDQIFVREILSRQFGAMQKARGLLSLAEAKIKRRETAMQELQNAFDCVAAQLEELRKAERDPATVDVPSPGFAAEA